MFIQILILQLSTQIGLSLTVTNTAKTDINNDHENSE